eukprot:CAMPEP_0119349506 /NCGR_PEP_ID=MMETSP1333-20130426/109584_1 /TAXON_ID=418940 /ORGANISM="Scyphosphaera apsteinii, Strain RCC1455" /LENGTH=77 /DNA_ID=CAMNT_0007362103 /DNA_START=2537 /DNA_END=2770 /DNA_ORIENTATION=-
MQTLIKTAPINTSTALLATAAITAASPSCCSYCTQKLSRDSNRICSELCEAERPLQPWPWFSALIPALQDSTPLARE